MRDDEARRIVLARRARFLAAALVGLGSGACKAPAQAPVVRPEATATAPAEDDEASPDAGTNADASAYAYDSPDRDSDGDGVPDAEDHCPREPGSAWNTRARGCPCLTIIEPVDIRILAVIAFAQRGAALSTTASTTLDDLARVLREHPELTVLVEGHVDDRERPALALDRAKAVVAALVTRGIDARRLRAASLAATRPFASNDSEAGRAENRRVTFSVVEGAGSGSVADAGSP